ncbi:MAG: HAD family hydrolase [Longimicrobiales bacterium]
MEALISEGGLPDRRIEAVLFDLDGTLIATRRLYLEAYRRTVAPHVGRLLSDDELLAFDARSERLLITDCVGAAQLTTFHSRFHDHYEQLHDTHFEGVFPGVLELLELIRARGLKTGIVTGKSRGAWRITAARVQLGDFGVIVVEDDVSAPKPDAHGLQLALSALQVEPQRALYVGDSTVDVKAAVAAGVIPVAALWSRDQDRRDQLLRSISGLPAMSVRTPLEIVSLLAG